MNLATIAERLCISISDIAILYISDIYIYIWLYIHILYSVMYRVFIKQPRIGFHQYWINKGYFTKHYWRKLRTIYWEKYALLTWWIFIDENARVFKQRTRSQWTTCWSYECLFFKSNWVEFLVNGHCRYAVPIKWP